MGENLRGYLVVKVLEAAGHNGEDVKVWDDSFKEVFAKSEPARRPEPSPMRGSAAKQALRAAPANLFPSIAAQLRSGAALALSRRARGSWLAAAGLMPARRRLRPANWAQYAAYGARR
jgi:hypothetical protein